eukprot:gene8068-10931_t
MATKESLKSSFNQLNIDLGEDQLDILLNNCSSVEDSIHFYFQNQSYQQELNDNNSKVSAKKVKYSNSNTQAAYNLSKHESDVATILSGININLSHQQIREISARSSNAEVVVQYYFENESKFSQAINSSNLNRNSYPPPPRPSNNDGYKIQEKKSDEDIDINYMNYHYPSLPPVYFKCDICMDDVMVEDMYTLNCIYSHRFCYPCIVRHVKMCIISPNPHIPACPKANERLANQEGCNYVMQEEEIYQLMNIIALTKGEIEEIITPLERLNIRKKISDLYMAKVHRENNHMCCVGCNNDDQSSSPVWFDLGDTRFDRQRVDCPRCRTSFCSLCQRTPFHYRSKCEEVLGYSRAWLEWLGGGRDIYLHEMRRRDEQYQQQAEDYNQKRENYEKDVAAAEARFQELVQYEQYKQGHCKQCPSCHRVIEKLSGCDSMVCGRNYHGGDIQNGCGASFNWTTAPAYVAQIGDKKTPAELDIIPPIEAQEVRHMINEDTPYHCDRCHEPIIGPRISCINCPIYNICLNCSTLPVEYPFYDNDDKSQNIIYHTSEHICSIIYRNNEHE